MSVGVLTCDLPDVGAVIVRIRSQAINLLVGSEAPSYSFDLAGRLIGAFAGGVNYRRGLDNRVLSKWRGPGGIRQRRWLSPDEAEGFLAEAYASGAPGCADDRRASAGGAAGMGSGRIPGGCWPLRGDLSARQHSAARPIPGAGAAGYRGLLVQSVHLLRFLSRPAVPGQEPRRVARRTSPRCGLFSVRPSACAGRSSWPTPTRWSRRCPGCAPGWM